MSAPLADSVTEAMAELAEAVRAELPAGAGGPRVYTDLTRSAAVSPPALAFGPPTFTWAVPGSIPSAMTLTAALVVAVSDQASARLYALLPQVHEAIETAAGAVIRRATPGSFDTESGALPAYLLEIEVSL